MNAYDSKNFSTFCYFPMKVSVWYHNDLPEIIITPFDLTDIFFPHDINIRGFGNCGQLFGYTFANKKDDYSTNIKYDN